jgi:hypothetical protein
MAQLVIPPGKEAAPVRGRWGRSLQREVPEGGTDTKPMWVRKPPIPLNSVLETSVAMFVLVFRTWRLDRPSIYFPDALALGGATVKEPKFLRKQADKAERMARAVSDAEISQSFLNLAKAYRSQADMLKTKKLKTKKKSGLR